jgi:hypothetical protein
VEGVAAQLRLARVGLARFGVEPVALRLLRHQHNTTVRVDAADGTRYVLRIGRPGLHDAGTADGEIAWLLALATDTVLLAPEPVAAPDGHHVVAVADPSGRDGDRLAVLLR